jgi:DNA mismatch repair protein MutL
MSQKIFKLSSEMIDKIAAGEVVENPASVVKELVENAIDAKSTHIRVEILQGGFEKIRIIDDGEGMSPEDALISIERHATSKLKDLDRIETMGFRGEALSSISAVSKFSLLTKERGAPEEAPATLFDKSELKKGARVPGTTIEVASLFYNTPARKKFQKSVAASLAQITKLMTKLALSHPEIAFTFIANEKEVFHVQKATWEARIASLLPPSYSKGSSLVKDSNALFTVYGSVGLPSEAKNSRGYQYLFINRRSVVSPYLSACVAEAFATRISSQEHPIFVLYLDINHEIIDVNVHPQKREVRLAREQEIGTLLKKAILKALSSNHEVEGAPVLPLEPFDFTIPKELFQKVPEETPTFFKQTRLDPIMIYRHLAFVDSANFNEVFENLSVKQGLLVFNLKEVSKRLLYDQICERMQNQIAPPLQMLFFPITLDLSYEDAAWVRSSLLVLESFGLLMREFGPTCFIIESIHPNFKEEEVAKIVDELILVIKGKGSVKEMALVGAHFASFSTEQFSPMIKDLMASSSPYLSPTGKPTMAHVKEADFDRLFKEFKVERSN